MKLLVLFLLAVMGLWGCSDSRPMPPREFTQEFARAVRVAMPGSTVTIKGDKELRIADANGKEITTFLDNAYATYSQDPKSFPEVVRRYVASVAELPGAAETVDRARIVGIVKDRRWLSEIRKSLKGRGDGKPPENVFEDLNDELVVVYAQDSPKNIRYLTPKDLEASGLKREELREIAVGNLKRIIPRVDLHPGPMILMITAGGDYEASLLLLDKFWSGGEVKVDGDIVVAIPARDLLLVTGSRNAAGIAKLREVSAKALRESPYRLTDVLFVYRSGRFVRFDR
jgi:uncharacterized protein YtpQ (UPF0354 family)